ncbi:MAG: ABC transporter ATP-binding protein [Ferrimicrobium sp.]
MERELVSPEGRRDSVRVEAVSKVFTSRGHSVLALHDVDLFVEPGSFVSVIGPSGCGKSTLLRIVGGLERPSSGAVTLHDSPRIAFVFQEQGLFPWLSVLDNVAFGLRMAGMAKLERYERASHWISRVGLDGFAHVFPDALSGGMRQRLSLARAFVVEPEILLMDEPMGALDEQTRLLIQEDLIRLWEETRKTVLLVTHSIDEGILLGDRVVVMTRRPGTIKMDLDVGIERPRSLHTITDTRFVALKAQIIDALHDEVVASLELS